jgi:hypothetical protein
LSEIVLSKLSLVRSIVDISAPIDRLIVVLTR